MPRDERALLSKLISQHEAIYNLSSTEYRNVASRNAAWEEVSKRYGKPVGICKEEWFCLRSSFNHARKRRISKANRNVKNLPPWRYEAHMAFLLPYMRGNIAESRQEESVENLSSPCSPSRSIQKSPSSPSRSIQMSPTPSCSSPPIKRRTTSVNEFADSTQFPNVMETLEAAHGHSSTGDDIDHFFLSMSKMAKKLPDMDRIRIQMDLHKAIYEADMKRWTQIQWKLE